MQKNKGRICCFTVDVMLIVHRLLTAGWHGCLMDPLPPRFNPPYHPKISSSVYIVVFCRPIVRFNVRLIPVMLAYDPHLSLV